ncbi:tail tubular protein [Prochlorococcus phage P-SCSP2]|nr:tail tubular protein [Prochlorococcus phage P-SCSP2]
MAVAATTELEAINIMLAAIGEAPVNTLTGSLPVDVKIAQSTLVEINKSVQAEGWSFNTEIDVTLTRNASKQIILPVDVLRVDANIHQHPDIDPIQRGLKLYDRLKNTFEFDEDLICTVVYFRDFEEIPEQARSYINIRAARIFVDRLVSDQGLRTYTKEDEIRARVTLTETDLANGDHNMLRGDPSLTTVFGTYSPANGLIR